jgi:opacity protein-like surface antigen
MTRKTSFIRRMKKYFVLAVITVLTCTLSAQTPAQDTTFKKIRFGGYGEILYQHMDYGPNRFSSLKGSPSGSRAYISVPRSIFAFDYKFRNDIVLGTEIEFEYGGTGAAMELEYSEGGEYEMEVEKGGEVVLEQFHLTKSFGRYLNIRIGHMIVPVGLTNAHHEPIFYFGTVRPEGDMTILPCTWHETGIAILGYFPAIRLNYELMAVNGLDPNGFSRANWVGSGRQKMFEQSIMTSPAFAGRLEYTPVQNLRIGASGYFNRSGKNSTKPEHMAGIDGDVFIISGDAQYRGSNLVARANVIYGALSDSEAIGNVNRRAFKRTGYACTPVGSVALAYGAEAGYNVFSFFSDIKSKLFPFVRYEYYNPNHKTEGAVVADLRYKCDLLTVGLNYYILPNLVVKADYGMRRIDGGNYNYENTFGISVGYTGWFIKK